MKKLFTVPGLALAMLVAACGDNGLRSPDFDAVLIDVIVDGPAQRAVGTTAQFRALGHFTTPPSTQGAIATNDITSDAEWSIVQIIASPGGQSPEESCRLSTQPANNATVNNTGLVTAVSQGTVYVKATFGDKAGCRPFTITPGGPGPGPVLQNIEVVPSTATIPAGTTQVYCARGFYSDAPGTSREITDTTVTWASLNTSIATVPAAPNNTGSCVTATGVAQGTTSIQASATNSQSSTLTDTGTLVVTAAVVRNVLRVVPAEATVIIGGTQEFVACGTYSDSSNATTGPCSTPPQGQAAGQPIADNQLDWTSEDEDIATIDATGLATGVAVGTVDVTATLKAGVGDPAPAQRSASAVLNVSDKPQCTTPIVGSNPPNADQVQVDDGSLCLACSVENEDDVIDQAPPTPETPDDTSATINASVSAVDLLGLGFIYITVHTTNNEVFGEGATPDEPGLGAGFFVSRPINDLLLAEVLSQVTISTYLDGVETADTAGEDDGPLKVVLLESGALLPPGVGEQPILLGIAGVTEPFNELRLTFNPNVASVLTQLEVYNACAEITFPPEPEEAP